MSADRDMRQYEVAAWCAAAFGSDHASNIPVRGLRLLEEALEAYQASTGKLTPQEAITKAHALVDYVFNRPVGELQQELGGVGVTLLALAEAAGISADDAELNEVKRVKSKPLAHFNKRNEEKNKAGFSA